MIRILKNQLVEAMRGFRLLKIQNNSLPVLCHVLVKQKQGKVELHGTNLDENLVYRFSCDSNDEATFLLPYDLLRDAERHADAKTEIELTEKFIRITVSGSWMELLIEDSPAVDDFPPTPELTVEGIAFDPVTLSAIQVASRYVRTENKGQALQGVHISRKKYHCIGWTSVVYLQWT